MVKSQRIKLREGRRGSLQGGGGLDDDVVTWVQKVGKLLQVQFLVLILISNYKPPLFSV